METMTDLSIGSEVVESSAPAADAVDNAQNWDQLTQQAADSVRQAPEEVPGTDDEPTPLEPQVEEPEAKDEPEPEAEKPDVSEDPDKELSKRDKRSLNFAEMRDLKNQFETENSDLKTQIAEKETRLAEIDAQLEQFGGVDGMQQVVDVVQKLHNPAKAGEVADYITGLPHASQLQSIFTARALGIGGVEIPDDALPQVMWNQATVFNSVLQGFQGLKTPFAPEHIEKIGEWLSARANENLDDLMKDIMEDLEESGTPEARRVKALEQEVAALKATKAEPSATGEQEGQNPADIYTQLAEKFDSYEKQLYPTVAEPILDTYMLKVNPTDPEDVKLAKTTFNDMLFAYQSLSGRESNAFQIVANYLEKNAEKSDGFRFAEGDYKRAIRLSLNKALSDISPLFKGTANGKKPAPPNVPKNHSGADITPSTNGSNGKIESWEDLQKSAAPRR